MPLVWPLIKPWSVVGFLLHVSMTLRDVKKDAVDPTMNLHWMAYWHRSPKEKLPLQGRQSLAPLFYLVCTVPSIIVSIDYHLSLRN